MDLAVRKARQLTRREVVEVLDRSTCVELLRTVVIGRVAWATEPGDAVVVPVNFIVVDDDLIFRTAEGAKLLVFP